METIFVLSGNIASGVIWSDQYGRMLKKLWAGFARLPATRHDD